MRSAGSLIPLAMLVLTIGGCRKNQTFLTIDSYAASLFTGYEQGTYWIYKDSTGLIIDSEAIISSDCVSSGFYVGGEQCDETISSNSLNSLYYYVAMRATRFASFTEADILYNLGVVDSNDVYNIYLNNGSIDTLDTLGTDGMVIKKLSTYQVNQFTFSNALKIMDTISPVRYIIAVPNIGIVERLVPGSGYVLKLTKYHIVR